MERWKATGMAAVMAVAMWTGTAMAGPLAPNLAVNASGDFVFGVTGADGKSYIAGEGAAPNRAIITGGAPPGAVQHVDWVVRHDGLGFYTYFYQLENSSNFSVNNFNIGAPTFPPSGFFVGTDGFSSGVDIDTIGSISAGIGHTLTVFANLGDPTNPHDPVPGAPFNNPAVDETEAASGGIVDPSDTDVSSLFVTFGGATGLLVAGKESALIFVKGTQPNYGDWLTSGAAPDGLTVVSWSSDALNPTGEAGVKIPIPVAEPTGLAMLGVVLFGSAVWVGRGRNRK